jgi:hypothetical protein
MKYETENFSIILIVYALFSPFANANTESFFIVDYMLLSYKLYVYFLIEIMFKLLLQHKINSLHDDIFGGNSQ